MAGFMGRGRTVGVTVLLVGTVSAGAFLADLTAGGRVAVVFGAVAASAGAAFTRALFPVGELDGGRFIPGIDEYAELYVVDACLSSFGRMPVAMDNLVLGIMPTDVP